MTKIVRKSLSDSPMTTRRDRRLGKFANRRQRDRLLRFSGTYGKFVGKRCPQSVLPPSEEATDTSARRRRDLLAPVNMAGVIRPERMLCSGLPCCRT
jgi:hypothetical protein